MPASLPSICAVLAQEKCEAGSTGLTSLESLGDVETYLTPTSSSPQRNTGSLEGTAEPWPCDQLAVCLVHLVRWLAPGCVPSSMASSGQVTGYWGLMSSMGAMLLACICQKAMMG